MKKLITILSMMLGLVALTQAGVPKDPTFNDFRLLPARSPFVIKKKAEPVAPTRVNTALSLRGVSKFKDGWVVTVVDRKEPQKNIILREGAPVNKKGIRLLKVNQSKDGYANTTAVVLSGGRQITVSFNMASIKSSHKQSPKAVKPTATRLPPVPTSSNKAGSTTSSKKSSSGRRPRVRRTTPSK